jgi:hypothetical protein
MLSVEVDGIYIEYDDMDFKERIESALSILHANSRDTGYIVAKNNLGKIKQYHESYVKPWESPVTFYISRFTAFPPYDQNHSLIWCAGAIAHDAYHSKLYKANEKWEGREAELRCCEFQMKICEDLNAPDHIINHMSDLIAGIKNGTIDYWSNPDRKYDLHNAKILITLIENGTADYWSSQNTRYAISLSQCLRPEYEQ